jgi:hypothetical protein
VIKSYFFYLSLGISQIWKRKFWDNEEVKTQGRGQKTMA